MGFCGNCGAQIKDDEKFCNGCGTANEAAKAPTTPPVASGNLTAGPGELLLGQFAKFNAADEDDAFVTVSGVTVKADLLYKILSGVLLGLFFLPFFTFDLWITTIRISGLNAAFGNDYGSGDAFAVILFFVPFILFAIFQFKKSLLFLNGKLFLYATIVSGVGVLLMIILSSRSGGNVAPAFILSAILYVLAGVVAFAFMTAAKRNN